MVADLRPKPPKRAVARTVGGSIEGRQGGLKDRTAEKKATVAKETATPSRKRKAVEHLEEVSAAVSDVVKRATSNIYKKRKVVAKAKAEAVADTKSIEREARVLSEKKRKAADALEGDAAQAGVHGGETLSAKKRRREDKPVVETEPLEEATVSSKNVKTEEVFVPLRRASWSDSHSPIGSVSPKLSRPSGEFDYPKGSNERVP